MFSMGQHKGGGLPEDYEFGSQCAALDSYLSGPKGEQGLSPTRTEGSGSL